MSSSLQGLGVTGTGWEWERVCCCVPQEGGWHGTLGGNKSGQAIRLRSCSEEVAGASSLTSSRCGVRALSSHRILLRSPTLKFVLSRDLTSSTSTVWRQLVQFFRVSSRRPEGNLTCRSLDVINLRRCLLKDFIFLFYYFMCMSVWSADKCRHFSRAWCQPRPEGADGSSATGVTGGCQLAMSVLGTDHSPVGMLLQVLLTTEPSLQLPSWLPPPPWVFRCHCWFEARSLASLEFAKQAGLAG